MEWTADINSSLEKKWDTPINRPSSSHRPESFINNRPKLSGVGGGKRDQARVKRLHLTFQTLMFYFLFFTRPHPSTSVQDPVGGWWWYAESLEHWFVFHATE